MDTHCISALAGSGSFPHVGGVCGSTEIHLAGKAAVMLSSAALSSMRMKEMSSHGLKYSPLVYFDASTSNLLCEAWPIVLRLSKRCWIFNVHALRTHQGGFLLRNCMALIMSFGRLRLGQFCGLYSGQSVYETEEQRLLSHICGLVLLALDDHLKS